MAEAEPTDRARLQGGDVQQRGVCGGGGGEAGAPALPPARAPLRHKHGLLVQHRLNVGDVGRQIGSAAGVGQFFQQLRVPLQPLRTLQAGSR